MAMLLATVVLVGASFAATASGQSAQLEVHVPGLEPAPAPAPAPTPATKTPLPRRYDIEDMGWKKMFHGWADVQGQGAANDYCRFLGYGMNLHLDCALAGPGNGTSAGDYTSQRIGFDHGYKGTWYMKDEDGDGRDDYCRCVGNPDNFDETMVMCTKAGAKGFYGSDAQPGAQYTFRPQGEMPDCAYRKVRPELGLEEY